MTRATSSTSCSVSFQSPRRWGGVGVGGEGRLRGGAIGFRFNPLGGGAGSGDSPPSGPRKRARFVSIPSEVGRGRAQTDRREDRGSRVDVSIRSEVGRGRARGGRRAGRAGSCTVSIR